MLSTTRGVRRFVHLRQEAQLLLIWVSSFLPHLKKNVLIEWKKQKKNHEHSACPICTFYFLPGMCFTLDFPRDKFLFFPWDPIVLPIRDALKSHKLSHELRRDVEDRMKSPIGCITLPILIFQRDACVSHGTFHEIQCSSNRTSCSCH